MHKALTLLLALALVPGCDNDPPPGADGPRDAGLDRPRPDLVRVDGPDADMDSAVSDILRDVPVQTDVAADLGADANKPLDTAKPDQPKPKPDLFKPPKPDLFKPKPDLFKPKPDLFKPKPDLFKPKPDMFKPKPDMFKPKPDMPVPPDMAPLPDMPPPPDLAQPDQPIPPDLAQPDQPIPPDTFSPDQYVPPPDMSKPPDTGTVTYTGSFPSGKTGYVSASLGVAGYTRKVVLYVPKSVGTKPPMLITLHGTHGLAKYMIQSSYAKDLADSKKVLIVSPQARKLPFGDWDDHYPNDVYWETYPGVDPSKNPDLLLIQAMILEAQKSYNVDPKRVYVLGHSNGGFFSILVAMTLKDKIAAFAANSSGLVKCAKMPDCSFTGNGTSCSALSAKSGYTKCASKCTGAEKPGSVATSGRKPPGYLAHSSDDNTVSVYYTCALSARMSALGYTQSVTIYTGNGHSIPYNLAVNAWTFLSKYSLP